MMSLSPFKRTIFFIILDIFISILTVVLAYLLRFNFNIPLQFFPSMILMIMILLPLKIAFFFFFKIYFIAWRFFGLAEYKKIIFAHIATYFIFIFIFILLNHFFSPYPRSVILIDFFLSLFFIGFLRISKRVYLESGRQDNYKTTLIFGANERASQIIKNVLNGEIHYYPVALLSRDKYLIGTYFSNLKVYNEEDIEDVIEEYEITSVIITESLEQRKLDASPPGQFDT